MSKKEISLVVLLVVIATTYVCFFTTWFKPKKIGIFHTARQTTRMMRRIHNHDLPYVLFGLEGRYRLTDVKVVALDKFNADPNTSPVWHLISDSNSVWVQQFAYGQRIGGMKPAFEGERPDGLETNVTYRLFVIAGRATGFNDFTIQ